MDKRLAILEIVAEAARAINDMARDLPKTGKRRNIFIKGYNRRPGNKAKRKAALARIALRYATAAFQISVIKNTPNVPDKYKRLC